MVIPGELYSTLVIAKLMTQMKSNWQVNGAHGVVQDPTDALARGGGFGMPEYSERRAKGPEGYRDYLVKRITYAKGEIVTRYYPGTVYHWKKGNFVCRDSPLTGEARLHATRSITWEWTSRKCPTCFDHMCESYIDLGWCRRWS